MKREIDLYVDLIFIIVIITSLSINILNNNIIKEQNKQIIELKASIEKSKN